MMYFGTKLIISQICEALCTGNNTANTTTDVSEQLKSMVSLRITRQLTLLYGRVFISHTTKTNILDNFSWGSMRYVDTSRQARRYF